MQLNVIHNEDCRTGLKKLPDQSVHCGVTSPPYYGLRDYGVSGQIGLEISPSEYVANIVSVFSEFHRVLRNEGTLWLNLGDSYAHNGAAYGNAKSTLVGRKPGEEMGKARRFVKKANGLKPKDLIGIPWMVAFALREAGWYLRSDIIWSKKNCMPESVTDRPTRSHEYIFLLSKSRKYYYDSDAIKEPAIYDVDGTGTAARKARQKADNKILPTDKVNGIRKAGYKDPKNLNGKFAEKQRGHGKRHQGFNDRWDKMTHEEQCTGMRNKRDVWNVATAMYSEAHFATFPPELIVPCIKAGCPEGGVILDPFIGAGTTALVARKLNRNFIGYELNPSYITIAENRLKKELGLFV